MLQKAAMFNSKNSFDDVTKAGLKASGHKY